MRTLIVKKMKQIDNFAQQTGVDNNETIFQVLRCLEKHSAHYPLLIIESMIQHDIRIQWIRYSFVN